MPIYVQECPQGHEFDVFLHLADYNTPQTCQCGLLAKRKIVPTMIRCDIAPWDAYESPSSGKLITSYKERREDMVRTDCVDYEPSLKKQQKKTQKESELKLEKAMDDTVEEAIEKMPTAKREKLSNELVSGADINLIRS